jgi:excisionase family DNA binding protein
MSATKTQPSPTKQKRGVATVEMPTARPIQWPETGVATYDDAAMFLQLSTRTIKRLVSAGKLTPISVSRRAVRLSWAQLRKYAELPAAPDPS